MLVLWVQFPENGNRDIQDLRNLPQVKFSPHADGLGGKRKVSLEGLKIQLLVIVYEVRHGHVSRQVIPGLRRKVRIEAPEVFFYR